MTTGRVLLIILALATIIFTFIAISDKWKPAGVDRVPPLPPRGTTPLAPGYPERVSIR